MVARLPSAPPVIVVDNGSDDGTVAMLRAEFPEVAVIALAGNRGAVARNLGVAAAATELIAFSDDDSWWAPGALERARSLFDSIPDLGLVAARVLVGPDERLDPTCQAMAASPLGGDASGHRRILGFVACGAVARRQAVCESGGFEELLFFLGEEETLALDMAARGWKLLYAPEVVAFHHPGKVPRDRFGRHRREARNRVLAALIHRPWSIVRHEARATFIGPRRRPVRAGLWEAVRLAPHALLRRRPLPSTLEASRRLLD